MSWLAKTAKKAAKKAASRATSSAWKAIKKKAKPAKKKLSTADQQELDAWRFWGRSLGSLSRRLKGKKSVTSARPAASPSPRADAKPKKSSSPKPARSKAPLRKRAKGERGPVDPRFERTQAKYEARKSLDPSLTRQEKYARIDAQRRLSRMSTND